MLMTESVPEFVFGKSLGFIISDNGRDYDGFCGKVFPGLRLTESVKVMLQAFSINGSDTVSAGVY